MCRERACTYTTMMELLWYASHCPCLCARTTARARVCVDFSCRGVDHDTAVNLKGKLINWSPSDSLTSSPRNGLCSLTLGKNCHVLLERRDLHLCSLPPSLPPIPFISLIMSLCQRQGGVIQKEKRRARTGGNLRQARGIIH